MCTRRPLAQPPSSLPRNLRRIAHGGAEPADEGATRGGNDRPLILPTRRPIRRPPSGPHLVAAQAFFPARGERTPLDSTHGAGPSGAPVGTTSRLRYKPFHGSERTTTCTERTSSTPSA